MTFVQSSCCSIKSIRLGRFHQFVTLNFKLFSRSSFSPTPVLSLSLSLSLFFSQSFNSSHLIIKMNFDRLIDQLWWFSEKCGAVTWFSILFLLSSCSCCSSSSWLLLLLLLMPVYVFESVFLGVDARTWTALTKRWPPSWIHYRVYLIGWHRPNLIDE